MDDWVARTFPKKRFVLYATTRRESDELAGGGGGGLDFLGPVHKKMRLRECIVTGSGRSCFDSVDPLVYCALYGLGRCVELVMRDILCKCEEIPTVDASAIDFS
jgi:hypothetical protein